VSGAPRPHHGAGGADQGDPLFDALARPTQSPDLTPSIMGRLGFVQMSAAATRRRRFRAAALRGTMCLAAFAVVAAGIIMHDTVRRPSVDPSIPAAIGNDLNHLRRTIQSIRNLAPRPDRSRSSDGSADDARWGGYGGQGYRTNDVIDEDVDRSAIAPVKWL